VAACQRVKPPYSIRLLHPPFATGIFCTAQAIGISSLLYFTVGVSGYVTFRNRTAGEPRSRTRPCTSPCAMQHSIHVVAFARIGQGPLWDALRQLRMVTPCTSAHMHPPWS
jgi:hypothetical protein